MEMRVGKWLSLLPGLWLMCLVFNLHAIDGKPPKAGAIQDDSPFRSCLAEELSAIHVPNLNTSAAVDDWESFVRTYQKRAFGTSNNIRASEFLCNELSAAGYHTRVIEFSRPSGPVRVVEGVRPGRAQPQRHLVIMAHYDGFPGTTQAAYDNGSGVAVTLCLARMLARVETRKTIVCLFFDAEEMGLWGSKAYVTDIVAKKNSGVTYDLAVNFDMVGLQKSDIKDWNLYVLMGLDTLDLETFFPENKKFLHEVRSFLLSRHIINYDVEIVDQHDRISDDWPFKLAGIPVLRFCGGRYPFLYSMYHTASDTVDRVYGIAGGRKRFEDSFENAVITSYYVIMAYDSNDPKKLFPVRPSSAPGYQEGTGSPSAPGPVP
jgi:hypothetical protein